MVEFRLYLPDHRRVAFDKACEHYRQCRERAYPAFVSIDGQLIEPFPRSEEVKKEFALALECLLRFADEK
jgi:hypothetical protein